MPYLPDPKDRHSMLHYLSLVEAVGQIGNMMHVNLHVYNSVPPDTMEGGLKHLEEAVAAFRVAYARDWHLPVEALEH